MMGLVLSIALQVSPQQELAARGLVEANLSYVTNAYICQDVDGSRSHLSLARTTYVSSLGPVIGVDEATVMVADQINQYDQEGISTIGSLVDSNDPRYVHYMAVCQETMLSSLQAVQEAQARYNLASRDN